MNDAIPEPDAIPLREWVDQPTFIVVPPTAEQVRDRAALLFEQDPLFHARVVLAERVIADLIDLDDRKVLVDVLANHWATRTSGCGCGWAELGRSHPEHVADIYNRARDKLVRETACVAVLTAHMPAEEMRG